MIPLKDNIPTLRRPLVTWALIAMNVAVFLFSISRPDTHLPGYRTGRAVAVTGFDRITLEYGFVPCELAGRCAQPDRGVVEIPGTGSQPVTGIVRVPEVAVWLTVFSAMFMHGGWLHILGNMLFLWIFGNNVEDAMGRLRYLVFYLACGVGASLAQFWIGPTSGVPNIGASGAIAGVLGGYVMLHPRARVLTAIPLLIFFYVVEIPAVLVLTAWFALQVFDGSASVVGPSHDAGVAYFAHIGGFVLGFLLVRAFARGRGRRRRGLPSVYG